MAKHDPPEQRPPAPIAYRKSRLTSGEPLEMWEILAEEFETGERKLSAAFEAAANHYYLRRREAEDNAKTEKDPAKLEKDRSEVAALQLDVETKLFQDFHAQPRTALCLSGGGVRSATFSLGVLHGLAKARDTFQSGTKPTSPLTEFDFLSTVSGGGYIGGWFSAWAAREEAAGKNGPATVVDALADTPITKLDPEPEALLHLRKYCRFLNPKMGALSADTWTLVATVLRNMILNWLVLIPLFMAVLVLPLLYRFAVTPGGVPAGDLLNIALWLGAGFGVWAAAYVGSHIPSLNRNNTSKRLQGTETDFVLFALIPFTLSALFLTLHWAWRVQATGTNYSWVAFCAFGAGVYALGTLVAIVVLTIRNGLSLWLAAAGMACSIVSGGIAGFTALLISNRFINLNWSDPAWKTPQLYACVAVPLVLLMFHVAAILAVGLTSELSEDDDRE